MQIDYNGQKYTPVKVRLKALVGEGHRYDLTPMANQIFTSMGELLGWHVVAHLEIKSGPRQGKYHGNAFEKIDPDDPVNALNALENAETSAVGRALALAGFMIDDNIASAEEIVRARLKEAKTNHHTKGKSTVEEAERAVARKQESKEPPVKKEVPVKQEASVKQEEPVQPDDPPRGDSGPQGVEGPQGRQGVAHEEPKPEPKPEPESFKQALPEKLEKIFLDGNLDEYMLSLPFDEFRATLVTKKVPRASGLKRDTRENRLTYLAALKKTLNKDVAETEPSEVEPKEDDPKEEKELKEKIGGTLQENYDNTGNRYGINIPSIPEGKVERPYPVVMTLWEDIEAVVKSYDRFMSRMRRIVGSRYKDADNFLCEGSVDEINQVLNLND